MGRLAGGPLWPTCTGSSTISAHVRAYLYLLGKKFQTWKLVVIQRNILHVDTTTPCTLSSEHKCCANTYGSTCTGQSVRAHRTLATNKVVSLSLVGQTQITKIALWMNPLKLIVNECRRNLPDWPECRQYACLSIPSFYIHSINPTHLFSNTVYAVSRNGPKSNFIFIHISELWYGRLFLCNLRVIKTAPK